MAETPTKVDLEIMFRTLLHGDTGETSVGLLVPLVYQLIQDEKQRAIEACSYHLIRPGLKDEYKAFAREILNSVLAGPTYSTPDSTEKPVISRTPSSKGYT